MSQENVEFIQQAADALHKGDLQRVEALLQGALDPAFEYQSLALDQVHTGLSGMRDFFADMREVWRDYDQEIEELVDLGDDVVVVLRVAARGTGGGVPIAQQSVWLWTFRDRRAVRAKAFRSKREALEAAQLSE
jgi:ketosteroid isomerase-like protein